MKKEKKNKTFKRANGHGLSYGILFIVNKAFHGKKPTTYFYEAKQIKFRFVA